MTNIYNVHQLKGALKKGMYADGGYPMYFITSDGAALSFKTVEENLDSVLDSIEREINDGWRVIAYTVNWQDPELRDDHTSEFIESAYGSIEEELSDYDDSKEV